MMQYHKSNVGHAGLESLVQPGMLGDPQHGGRGMEMHGTHSQHPIEVGSGGIKHMAPSVS